MKLNKKVIFFGLIAGLTLSFGTMSMVNAEEFSEDDKIQEALESFDIGDFSFDNFPVDNFDFDAYYQKEDQQKEATDTGENERSSLEDKADVSESEQTYWVDTNAVYWVDTGSSYWGGQAEKEHGWPSYENPYWDWNKSGHGNGHHYGDNNPYYIEWMIMYAWYYYPELFENVEFEDENLKEALLENDRINWGLDNSEISYFEAMWYFDELDLKNKGIEDLKGLDAFVNVTDLDLMKNSIEDLSPISDMDGLRILNLDDNDLYDIRPLADLKSLQKLYLNRNDLRDLEPLRYLYSLRVLELNNNRISNIEPIAGIGRYLDTLKLSNNDLWDKNTDRAEDYTYLNFTVGRNRTTYKVYVIEEAIEMQDALIDYSDKFYRDLQYAAYGDLVLAHDLTWSLNWSDFDEHFMDRMTADEFNELVFLFSGYGYSVEEVQSIKHLYNSYKDVTSIEALLPE